jgi:hypothetical protein
VSVRMRSVAWVSFFFYSAHPARCPGCRILLPCQLGVSVAVASALGPRRAGTCRMPDWLIWVGIARHLYPTAADAFSTLLFVRGHLQP